MRCWATTTDTPAQGAEGLGSMGGGRDEAPGPSRLVLAEDAPPTPPAGSHAPGTFVCVVGGGGCHSSASSPLVSFGKISVPS